MTLVCLQLTYSLGKYLRETCLIDVTKCVASIILSPWVDHSDSYWTTVDQLASFCLEAL